MAILLPLHKISKKDVNIVGGKGASLGEMTQAGIPVPPGFVVTAETFQQFAGQEMPIDVKEEILKAFDQLGTKRVAVRSSALTEDSSTASWAGQLESCLSVSRDQLLDKIRECWNSIRSERALAYAAQQNLSEDQLMVAVVIQLMVNSESSGVMFTVNPITKNPNEIMIEAGFGLGEMLVQGVITPDNFVVDKQNLEVNSRDIQSQEVMLVWQDGKNQEVSVPEDKQNQSALTDNQIKELVQLGVKIEKHYGVPQDIEWALEKDKLYILQSRPITTLGLTSVQTDPSTAKVQILVEGIAASPGTASGKVRLILLPNDISQTKEGEILVAEKTSPDFMSAFAKVVAVVTDQGGITSHAAIVSRELGIPAVVGTKNATKLLKNGQEVTVDGDNGKIYQGKVEIKTRDERLSVPARFQSTGDDIEDFLLTLTTTLTDTAELWPLSPSQLFPYIDLDQSLDLYQKLSFLIKKRMSFKEIAGLFKRSRVIREFLVDSAASGLKAAHRLGIGNISINDQTNFITLLIKLLKQLSPEDPFCLQGTNRVWAKAKVNKFIKTQCWVEVNEELKKALNLLSANLFTLTWSFYWDYFSGAGSDIHGPYPLPSEKFREDRALLVKDYYNLAPKEIWSLAKKVPFKSIVLAQTYDYNDIFVSFGNRVINYDNLSKYNNYFSLIVDKQAVYRVEEIVSLTEQIKEIAAEQISYVNKLTDFDKVRKGAKLAYYSLKDFYLNFDDNWFPKERVEKTIKLLGRRFIDQGKAKVNRDKETTRKLFDPRNDFLP